MIVVTGQVLFGHEKEFHLTSSKQYFHPGEEVILECKENERKMNEITSRRDIFFEKNG